jgi:hypothetical protein
MTIINHGVPISVSNTYYILEKKRKGLGWIFTLVMTIIAFTAIAPMLEVSEGKDFQFLGFLCAVGLAFVGVSPQTKLGGMEKTVHYVSAIISIVSAILYTILFENYGGLILLMLFGIGRIIIDIILNNHKNVLFWIEIVAFGLLYHTLLVLFVV